MLASDATVLDRHKELLRWRQQQQQQQQQQQSSHSYFGNGEVDELPIPIPITNHEISHEILGDLCNGWPDLVPGRCSIPCLTEGNFSGAVKDSIFGSSSESRKREAEETRVGKQLGVDETEDVVRVRKKMKGSAKESVQPKLEVQQSSSDNSEKENPKVPEPAQKPDYIHVRARRGQATDSHSLAERVRREKISERMKYLQDLVPGCNKITGKAGMLDEIINYVQSLQRQVEFLSMKLAAVNPRLDINIDHFFSKEMNPASCGGFPAIEMPMPTDGVDPSYLQSNFLQHAVAACGGLDMALNPQGQGPPFAWDVDIQSLYNVEFHQGRGITFPFLSSQGNIIPYNPKMD